MTRQINIIFYGLACFDPQGNGYRVLLPDGRAPGPFDIPPHYAAICVRPLTHVPHSNWPEPVLRNIFPIRTPSSLTITGLNSTPPNRVELLDRLPNLRQSDGQYQIAANREAIVEMTVDRGTLSAHQRANGEMIKVLWQVEADDDATVRFVVGGSWIEIGPFTTQIIIANIGTRERHDWERDSDFNLYRKLSTDRSTRLPVDEPDRRPLPDIPVQDPPDGIFVLCPLVDCSPAFSQ